MLDLAAYDAMMMDHYADGTVENIGFLEAPGFALMAKSAPETVGPTGARQWVQPVGTRLTNQGSSDFATAAAASGNESKFDAFLVPRVKHYRFANLSNELLLATAKGRPDAFQKALDETNRALKAEMLWANFRIYRGRGGAIGRMANAGVATTVISCDDPSMVTAVSEGDILQLSADDGTAGAVRAGTLTVASVQWATKLGQVATITCTGNINAGVGAAAVDDFVFLKGDFGLAPTGFADYIPRTAALAATSLHSFARNVDSRLGGAIVDGRDMPLKDLLNDMVFGALNYGGGGADDSRTVFANPLVWGKLSKELDAKTVIVQAAAMSGERKSGIGVRVKQVELNGVTFNAVLDPMMTTSEFYGVDLDSYDCFHAGRFPGFLTEGLAHILIPSYTADGWICRTGGYLNFATKRPHRGVVGLIR